MPMLAGVRHVAVLLGASILLASCGDVRPGTRLALAADAVELLTDDCPATPIAPIKLEHVGDAVVFTDAATGKQVAILWPVGFAAWDINGVAVMHATDGAVAGREGETLSDIRAVAGARGDQLRVCAIGLRPYR
jgi:hypothetical protein